MRKKLFVGIILGALLFYLSLRSVRYDQIVGGLAHVKYGYIIPAVLIVVLTQVLRSLRWGTILKPLEKVNPFSVFGVTSVGFLAVIAIPARLGELARPYLITKKSHISMTSALGTILIERLADILTIMFMLACSLTFFTMPSWLIKSSIIFFLVTCVIAAFIIFMIVKREWSLKILSRLSAFLPTRYTALLTGIISKLIDGFQAVKDPKSLLAIALYSVVIWSINVVGIYCLFLAFGFNLPPVAAFVLLVVVIVGIAIPTAPGFVGNWHFFCIVALNFFGIAKADALTFAVVYHFLSIGVVVILGLIFLPFQEFSLSDFRQRFAKAGDV